MVHPLIGNLAEKGQTRAKFLCEELKKLRDLNVNEVDAKKGEWMIGNYDKVTGYLSFIIISSICLVYWLIIRKQSGQKLESTD